MGYEIDGVTVVCDTDQITEDEATEYVKIGSSKHPGLVEVRLTVAEDNPEEIDIEFVHPDVSFDRIRRITGYLVGTLERFNDCKRAEEADRVKHGVCCCN